MPFFTCPVIAATLAVKQSETTDPEFGSRSLATVVCSV
jgi:hypothetical protein